MVPEGWKEGCVGDLLHGLESGVSVNGEDREFDNSEFAVLKVSSVSYGTFNPRAAKVISGDQLERAKNHPKQGQIIISRSNTEAFVGASAYIDNDYPNLFLPDKLWQTKPKADANMKWLSYMLASDYARYSLSNLATGTSGSMKNITKGELLSLKLNIPPSSEQKKIAQILSTWDKAINTTEQLLANSQQQKKALMQQLLTGKKRLLDENGERFRGEWGKFEIGSLIRESRVRSETNNPAKRLTVRLNLKGVDVREFRGTEAVDSTVHYIRKAGQFIYGKQNIHKGAFGIIPGSLDGFETSQDLPAFDFTGECDPAWFFHFMTQEPFFASLESRMSGTGSKRLNPKEFFKIEIRCPSIKEQQKIASLLSNSDKKITALQHKLSALRQEKKALMQQLLTGKRPVKVDEEAA